MKKCLKGLGLILNCKNETKLAYIGPRDEVRSGVKGWAVRVTGDQGPWSKG